MDMYMADAQPQGGGGDRLVSGERQRVRTAVRPGRRHDRQVHPRRRVGARLSARARSSIIDGIAQAAQLLEDGRTADQQRRKK